MNIVAGETTVESRRARRYTVRVSGEDDVRNCTEEMGFAWPKGRSLQATEALADWEWTVPERACCARSLLRGMFLMGGTMNDPDKSYHYEIAVPSEQIGLKVAEVFSQFDCEPKIWERRGSKVIYLKDAEQIADALTVMDASAARMRFEDVRVVRSMRGAVQRKVNCEVSNIAKTTRASKRQVEAIETIRQLIGLSELPKELEEMARIRLENPVASLQELGSYADPPIGRSGVNHRLQKLCDIAEGLRLKEGG